MRPNKFGAIKTVVNGIKFDSKGESARYTVLKQRESEGLIEGLKTQVRFPIIVSGEKICTYVADFSYIADDEEIVEDFKSPASMTPVFKLKAKLLRATQGITIKVVMKANDP